LSVIVNDNSVSDGLLLTKMSIYEFVTILSGVVMKIHCIIKVLRIYMTKLFSLADLGGCWARIYDFLNVQTAKFPHASLAIYYKHNDFIRQRAKKC